MMFDNDCVVLDDPDRDERRSLQAAPKANAP